MTRVQIHKPVAMALALLVAGCSASATTPPSARPTPAVEVTPVVFQPVHQWDDFTGRLEAIQSVEVRPRVGGYVDAVALPEGAHVRKGQLLFQIDPRPFQAAVDRAAAQYLKAKADAALARADAARANRLIAERAIAQGEFERLDAAAKAAAAEVAAAKAALDDARLNLSFTHVVSPIDGRVSKALITKGNLVTTSSLLTTVVSDGPIYATFNADEQTFLKYAAAQRGRSSPVLMGLMTEDGFPHQGRLQFIDNAVDPHSGTIAARAVFDNADGRLTPGLFARVRLLSNEARPATLVPEQALAADLGDHYVMVLDARNHAQYRRVTLGPALGQLRVIRSGLKPGEQVVTAGLTKIKPGDAVQPTRVPAPALAMNAPAVAPVS